MLKYKDDFIGKIHDLCVSVSKYKEPDNICVELLEEEDGYFFPYARLTVNTDVKRDENCALIDTNNLGIGVIDMLKGVGEWTGRDERSGYCVYPEFRFALEALNRHDVGWYE